MVLKEKVENNIYEFFKSIQGEGKNQGKISLFIRFNKCNLKCFWCDTKYIKKEISKSEKEVKDFLKQNKEIENLVFTGGEPLLFQDEIKRLIEFAEELNKKRTYEIETNGTIKLKKETVKFFKRRRVLFNISPKPVWSQEIKLNVEPILINQLKVEKIPFIVKFVVKDKKDEDFVINIAKKYNISNNLIYVQPNCLKMEECLEIGRKVIKFCLENNFNFSSRIHILYGIK